MALKPIIISFLLFLYSLVAFSQAQKRYTGTVYSSDSSLLIKNVDVMNQRTKQTLRSDFDGSFGIDARPSDSIIFVHPHWNSLSILAEDLKDQVFLQKKSIVLEEIVVMGNTKAAKLKELESMKKDINLKADYITPVNHHGTCFFPLACQPLLTSTKNSVNLVETREGSVLLCSKKSKIWKWTKFSTKQASVILSPWTMKSWNSLWWNIDRILTQPNIGPAMTCMCMSRNITKNLKRSPLLKDSS